MMSRIGRVWKGIGGAPGRRSYQRRTAKNGEDLSPPLGLILRPRAHTTTLLIGRVVHHSKLRQRMSALGQKQTSATLFDPRCCENLFCLRRGEICEKCFRRVRGRSIAYERRAVARIVLDVQRQRTDQLEALWFEQLYLGDRTESGPLPLMMWSITSSPLG